MISTSGILSTGEKKWMPTKSSWRFTPVARPVIGSVEVLEPSSALGSTMSSISWNTLCLSSWFSNTASITKSTPARSAGSAVGGDLGQQRRGLLLGGLATLERLGSSPSEYALPFWAASMVTSLSTTSKPALADT